MRSERGSVSIVAAGVMVLSIVLAMGAADVAKVLVARARAQTAADLAALAAAQELAIPSGSDPAAIASEYAVRNDSTLVSCECPAGAAEASVHVSADVGPLLLFADDESVTADARAVVDVLPT